MYSIIIPTLNEEHYVSTLLSCLVEQTFQKFEVIVVDGNSEDGTEAVVKRYTRRLPLRFVSAKKRNVAHQRNVGARHAKYARLIFFDADVSIRRTFLEKLREFCMRTGAVLAGAYVHLDSSKWEYKLISRLNSIAIYGSRLTKPILNGAFIYSNRVLHKKINGFDESIRVGEDHDYADRMKPFARVRLFPEIVKTSPRRFELVGKYKLLFNYIRMGAYVILFGPIRKNIFDYPFGQYGRKNIAKKRK